MTFLKSVSEYEHDIPVLTLIGSCRNSSHFPYPSHKLLNTRLCAPFYVLGTVWCGRRNLNHGSGMPLAKSIVLEIRAAFAALGGYISLLSGCGDHGDVRKDCCRVDLVFGLVTQPLTGKVDHFVDYTSTIRGFLPSRSPPSWRKGSQGRLGSC
ncbi:hypothetical protein BO82DRAFT_358327 [Aspergillus uvarum CBS 121591]|uniref:Uncharacterized protein n=1 Tax=Aspergillus uvarum CBS 121591 TaxID=1448315 RepID=A0A319BXB3_9EURO|nr:hypothetical protein BO82DRAFT_358327 [Aspergillus uvarum CBS 121591]PYH77364.1 hypothetical protein BO82DRAFT_358327 [Aspergillus uvarum CBS 121591]